MIERSAPEERVAAEPAADRLGAGEMYVLSRVRNATAGPRSDVDPLVHLRGTREQRAALEQ